MLGKIPSEAITAILAILGGVAKYMKQILDGTKFTYMHLIGHLVIGGFTGFSMAKLGIIMGLHTDAQHLFAAWGGVIGLKAFEMVTDFLNKKIK